MLTPDREADSTALKKERNKEKKDRKNIIINLLVGSVHPSFVVIMLNTFNQKHFQRNLGHEREDTDKRSKLYHTLPLRDFVCVTSLLPK